MFTATLRNFYLLHNKMSQSLNCEKGLYRRQIRKKKITRLTTDVYVVGIIFITNEINRSKRKKKSRRHRFNDRSYPTSILGFFISLSSYFPDSPFLFFPLPLVTYSHHFSVFSFIHTLMKFPWGCHRIFPCNTPGKKTMERKIK